MKTLRILIMAGGIVLLGACGNGDKHNAGQTSSSEDTPQNAEQTNSSEDTPQTVAADVPAKPEAHKLTIEDMQQHVTIASTTHKQGSTRVTAWYDDAQTDPLLVSYKESITVTVKNTLDVDVPAEAYSVKADVYVEEYEGPKKEETLTLKSAVIPAHGEVTLEGSYSGSYENAEGTGYVTKVNSNIEFDPAAL